MAMYWSFVLWLVLGVALGRTVAQSLFDSAANTLVFQPISTITTPIVLNGQSTTETLATFVMSDFLNQGTLTIGNYNIQLQAQTPRRNQITKEVARAPKAVVAYTFKVCLTADPTAYDAVASTSLPISDPNSQQTVLQSQFDSTSQSSAGRRLLTNNALYDDEKHIFDSIRNSLPPLNPPALLNDINDYIANPDAFLNGKSSLAEITTFVQQLANNSLCSILTLGSDFANAFLKDDFITIMQMSNICQSLNAQSLSNNITTLNSAIANNTKWIDINTAAIANISDTLSAYFQFYNSQQNIAAQNFNATRDALLYDLNQVRNLTNLTDIALENLIAANYADLAGQVNIAFSYTTGNLSLLANLTANEIIALTEVTSAIANTVGNLSVFMLNYTATLEDELTTVFANMASINSIIYRELTQRTLRRALTSAYFQVISNIPSIFFPLVSDPGIAPQNGGVLTGTDARLLLDTYTVLSATSTLWHSTQISVYLSSDNELASAAVGVLDPRMMVSRFATSNCTLPYYDPTHPWRRIDGSVYSPPAHASGPCFGWFEVVDTYCTPKFANESFGWVTLQGGLTLTTGSTGLCAGSTATSYIMLDSIAAVESFMNFDFCNSTSGALNGFLVFSTALVQAFTLSIPNPTNPIYKYDAFPCSSTIYTQMLRTSTALGLIMTLGAQRYSTSAVLTQLAILEQKKYGALPSTGIRYEDLLFDGFVGSNTGTTTPSMCHRATVNIAHTQTLPIYAVLPDPVQPVTTSVTRLITKIDPTITTDYDQGLNIGEVVTFTEGIILTDNADYVLPDGDLLVGDLGQTSTFMYDPPQRLIDVTSNIYARINTVCYYCMPPGTLSTYTLPQFLQYSGNLYDASQATVGANLFAIPVTKDASGFPVCNVGGGFGDASGLQGATANVARTCSNPSVFTWENTTALTATMAGLCPLYQVSGHNFVTPIKLFNRRLDESTLVGSASWFDSSVGVGIHFLFENSASVTVISVTGYGSPTVSYGFTIYTDLVHGVVGIRFSSDAQIVTTSVAGLFDQRKHSFFFVLSAISGTSITNVAIFVDGVLDQYVALTTPIPTRLAGYSTWSSGTNGNFPYGTEALYAMLWPVGALSTILDTRAIDSIRLCSYAVAENHCTPNAATEVIAYAAPINAISTGTICPAAAVSLFRSSVLDLLSRTLTSVSLNTAAWSVTFWLQASPGWQAAVALSSGDVGVLVVTMGTTASTQIQLTLSITTAKQLHLVVTQSSVTLVDEVAAFFTIDSFLTAHKITLIYGRSALSQLSLSIDTISLATYPVSSLASPGAGVSYTVSPLEVITQLRLYPYALTATNVLSDFGCDALVGFGYISPTGFCRFSSSGETEALTYCRSPALCNGNCETYASVQSSTGSFANVGVNMCDDGWQAPLCTKQCLRLSNLTGMCLDDETSDPSVAASPMTLTPSGKWCNVLKAYQTGFDTTHSTMSNYARHWYYQISLPVPSGVITVNVNIATTCPVLSAVGQGNTASLTVTNPSGTSLVAKVVWTPVSNSSCIAPITIRQVGAFAIQYIDIPVCGNMTLSVYVLDVSLTNSTQTLCQSLTVNNVASLIAGATSATTNTNIISQSALVGDAAVAQVSAISAGLTMSIYATFQAMGIDTTALYALANAAAQEYAASNQIASDASAIQALASLRPPQVTTSCSSTACQTAMASIRTALDSVGFILPTAAPGSFATFNVPNGGCITTLQTGCGGGGGGGGGGTGGTLALGTGSGTTSSSSSLIGTSALYNSIFTAGSTNDKFTALGQFWAVLLVTVVIPFILFPLLLYLLSPYILPWLSSIPGKFNNFVQQLQEETETEVVDSQNESTNMDTSRVLSESDTDSNL
jgi:hypothetical protein